MMGAVLTSLRRRPLAIVFLGLSTAIAFVWCGIGTFIAAWLVVLIDRTIAAGLVAEPVAPRRTLSLVVLRSVAMVSTLATASWGGLAADAMFARCDPRSLEESIGFEAMLGALVFGALAAVSLGPLERLSASLFFGRSVFAGTPLRGYGISLLAFGVTALPLVIGSALTIVAQVPWILVGLFPLLAISIPLGRGLLLAEHVREPADSTEEPSPATLAVIAGLPFLALVLFHASLVRPTPPAIMPAPEGAELALPPETEVALPGTDLQARFEKDAIVVAAADGGGVGPIASPDGVDSARVVVTDAGFALVFAGGERTRVSFIDARGVRLDDSFADRIRAHVPPWGTLSLAAALLVAPLTVRRRYRQFATLAFAVACVVALVAAGLALA
jgi:hypothetical protein